MWKKPEKGRAWCGPLALTCVTQKSYKECYDAILTFRRQVVTSSEIRGTTAEDLIGALKILGYPTARFEDEPRDSQKGKTDKGRWSSGFPTLLQKVYSLSEVPSEPKICSVTGHWAVLCGMMVYDTHTPAAGIDIREHRCKRYRFYGWFTI